jgi:hypothetical protein
MFLVDEDEPVPVCGNCDYMMTDQEGRLICVNTESRHNAETVNTAHGCEKFFPDHKRWPEADHG